MTNRHKKAVILILIKASLDVFLHGVLDQALPGPLLGDAVVFSVLLEFPQKYVKCIFISSAFANAIDA